MQRPNPVQNHLHNALIALAKEDRQRALLEVATAFAKLHQAGRKS